MPKITITQALTRIIGEKHWLRRTFLGGLLMAIPVIFFFPMGYLIAVFRASMRGELEQESPKWVAGESFFLGVQLFVLKVLYFIIPAVVLYTAHFARGTGAYGTILTIGIVLAVLAALLMPWGIAIWLNTGCLKCAFIPKNLLKVFSFLGEYLDAIIRCFVLILLGAGTVFVAFLVGQVCSQLMGQVCGKYVPKPKEEAHPSAWPAERTS